MRLSKFDHEVLEQIDDLLLSENEGVRELLQQAMVLHVLSKEQDDKLRDKVYGPFSKMLHAMQEQETRMNSLENHLSTLESQLRNQTYQNHRTTGGYWSDSTTAVSQPWVTDTTAGGQWHSGLSGPALGNQSSSIDKDYIDKLSQWVKQVPTKSVTATAATDPDAMALIDPDTGHTMYVK